MKALPRRKGKLGSEGAMRQSSSCLNESPSQKEGKTSTIYAYYLVSLCASMKALPRRKGKPGAAAENAGASSASMKALPRRKGKLCGGGRVARCLRRASMKALPRRKGKQCWRMSMEPIWEPSMKALPRRKGKQSRARVLDLPTYPSMKALPRRKGKLSAKPFGTSQSLSASMKALPRRKGKRAVGQVQLINF